MKSLQRLSALAALTAGALASLAGSAHAADITWTTGPGFGGANGHQAILTNGTLVEALDIGHSSTPIVVDPAGLNITFQRVNPGYLGQSPYVAVNSAGSTDAGWNDVISTADYHGAKIDSVVALFNLQVGASYQLQLFAGDTRGCCNTRTQRFSDGNGHWTDPFVQGDLVSIVGTFTADGATQTLGFEATPGNSPILNAYVLRNVSAVPEPSHLALMLSGLLGLGFRLRSRR